MTKTLPNVAILVIIGVVLISGCIQQTDQSLKPYPEHGGLENETSSQYTASNTSSQPNISQYTESVPSQPIIECRYDNDCRDNQNCIGNKCVNITCSSGFVINHACKECISDSNCDWNKRCLQNYCNEVLCSDGYIQNHICIQYECSTNDGCESNEICVNRFCEAITCAKGEVAKNHVCTQESGLYNFAQKYITPFDATVISKLNSLTHNDYRNESFGENLDKVYYYATSVSYVYDSDKWGVGDYWQTSEQTINSGTGDCEDHAILLQSLIEALLYKTYGNIPNETIYMVCGCIDMDYNGKDEGCHCWNIIDASKLPIGWVTFSNFDSSRSVGITKKDIILNDVTVNNTKNSEKIVSYDPSKGRNKPTTFSVIWMGRKWVELESTWKMPLSYYENKMYPYSSVWEAFNSKEFYSYPDFIKQGRRPTIIDDLAAALVGFLESIFHWIFG